MNARQAAKAASLRILEQNRIMALNKADIVGYNKCILSMIAGGNPCEFCEDLEECQLEAKGKGCEQWMLRSQPMKVAKAESGDADAETRKESEKNEASNIVFDLAEQ